MGQSTDPAVTFMKASAICAKMKKGGGGECVWTSLACTTGVNRLLHDRRRQEEQWARSGVAGVARETTLTKEEIGETAWESLKRHGSLTQVTRERALSPRSLIIAAMEALNSKGVQHGVGRIHSFLDWWRRGYLRLIGTVMAHGGFGTMMPT
ncbi:hypothetical protein NFJ02_31g79600 [Pycnococcus provasolii]